MVLIHHTVCTITSLYTITSFSEFLHTFDPLLMNSYTRLNSNTILHSNLISSYEFLHTIDPQENHYRASRSLLMCVSRSLLMCDSRSLLMCVSRSLLMCLRRSLNF